MAETHREPRLVGYARISTYGQTLDNQLKQLRAAGCSSRNIYREKVTGAHSDRRELLRMLKRLAPGDVVTVTRIPVAKFKNVGKVVEATLFGLDFGSRFVVKKHNIDGAQQARSRRIFPANCVLGSRSACIYRRKMPIESKWS